VLSDTSWSGRANVGGHFALERAEVSRDTSTNVEIVNTDMSASIGQRIFWAGLVIATESGEWDRASIERLDRLARLPAT
jgi:hypothetical protein